MKTAWALLFVSFVLLPFYVIDSGLPQPGHLILLVAALSAIAANPARKAILTHPLCMLLGLFVGYVFVVNAANLFLVAAFDRGAYASGTLDLVEPFNYSAFYFFNFAIFCGVLCLGVVPGRAETDFWKLLGWAVLASVLVQTAAALLGLGKSQGSFRTILFFNNPNQLGYYALCVATMLMLCHSLGRLSPVLVFIGFACALYLSVLALSKAAFIAVVSLPVIFLMVGRQRSWRRIATVAVVAALIAVGAGTVDDSLLSNLEQRMSNIGDQQDDSLSGRAYDRIVDYPRYVAFGAGEGMRFRFDNAIEIHSLFGTLLFSYGVAGVAIIAIFVARLVRAAGISDTLYVAPVAVYNLAHNGIRSPLMWIVFAMIAVKVIAQLSATAAGESGFAGKPEPGRAGGSPAHEPSTGRALS